MLKTEKWTLYEIIWLLVFSLVAIVLTVVWKDSWFGFSVFITGVLCVILAAKGNIWTYIFGTYNTFSYAYVAYTNGLIGEMGLNLFFFAPMNLVGFIMWKKQLHGNTVAMRSLKWSGLIGTIVICVTGSLAMGYGLSLIRQQNTPYIDATTNVLSIVATFLMVWRYKEQWLVYNVLNLFTILMWSIRTMKGSPDGPMMIVMWSAYLINAVYGYYNWSKGAKLAEEAGQS